MIKMNLSIIVPHYNIPGMLCKLLESIPDRSDIEAIVIDDHSDTPIDTVKEYINSRTNIRLIAEDKNSGAGKCRNDGLSQASGKWVLFADSDDLFCEGFYETVSKYFESDADEVFFTATSTEIETGKTGTRHILLDETIRDWLKEPNNKKAELNIRYKLNGPVCKMIRMDLIREHKIEFEQVAVSNDEIFSTKVGYYAQKIEADERCIYCITCRPGSLIQVISEKNFWTRLQVFIRKYKFLKSKLSKEDFRLLDLSAQEKVFSAFQNRYGIRYSLKVFTELRRNGIPLFTAETFRPGTMISKIKLAIGLHKDRKKSKKYISKD